ncbi:hypothetical protein PROFUN_13325 [Planoprotostelium fungivorum]|uniref:Uncharacterized protein n=1 Tax=Planoprotostelium fungivorum TaxID=1890364 RepID=A0A2P6N464_9EUKA|nr:hypothetical protein PROFUN_13325 [Planoprotostelium fungivorum]
MPTERQLLVHSLESLGYIGDLRKENKVTLRSFSRNIKMHLSLVFICSMGSADFTVIYDQQKLTAIQKDQEAGVASQYDYTFLPDTWFSESVSAVAQICQKQMLFYLLY